MLTRRIFSGLAAIALHSAILGLGAVLGGTNGFLAACFVGLVIEACLARLRYLHEPWRTPSRGADSPRTADQRTTVYIPATGAPAPLITSPTAERQKEELTMTIDHHQRRELCISNSSGLEDHIAIDHRARRNVPTTSQPAPAAATANKR